MTERAINLNPTIAGHYERLSAIYALLGRNQEAQDAYKKSLKAWNIGRFPANLTTVMSAFFIEDRKVADRYAEGLIKAGWPGKPTEYYKIYEENRLNGEEIRSVVSGHEITTDEFGRTYWVDYNENGNLTDLSRLREGQWWIEGDSLCYRLEGETVEYHVEGAEKDLPRLKGLDNCGEIYRNPDSVPGSGKQYLYVKDYCIAALTTK
jgi:tetratricopeptide (TPR) repeat protein